MTLFIDNGALEYKHLGNVVIEIILAGFTLLTVLTFKDSVTQFSSLIIPDHTTKKLIFTISCTLLFLFISVILAWQYQESL